MMGASAPNGAHRGTGVGRAGCGRVGKHATKLVADARNERLFNTSDRSDGFYVQTDEAD
jgi:hypothetical protein